MATEIKKHIEMLGLKVKDRVTGFRGVVASMTFDLYGCVQAIVTPFAKDDGKLEDSRYFDVSRLEVEAPEPVMRRPNYDFGPVAEGLRGATEKPSPSRY